MIAGGPWKWVGDELHSSSGIVAKSHTLDDTNEPQILGSTGVCRLIQAAPEMYEALLDIYYEMSISVKRDRVRKLINRIRHCKGGRIDETLEG